MSTKLSLMETRIVLLRLRHLHLISYDTSAMAEQTGLHYFFYTPNLNRLDVGSSVPVECVLSTLESSVDSPTTLMLARSGFKVSNNHALLQSTLLLPSFGKSDCDGVYLI